MKIQQEAAGDLVLKLNITLEPTDYKADYEKKLNAAKKSVQIPGYRPGKVPTAVVKKKYGKSILAEEINRVIGDALNSHIQENKLRVLGNPLPLIDGSDGGDWDNPEDFKYAFEIGLAPEFEVKLSKKDKYPFRTIKVDDEMLEGQIGDMARRYGKMSEPTEAGEKDMLICDLVELNADGQVLEGGIFTDTSVSLEFVEKAKLKKELVGTKAGDVVVVNPKDLAKDDNDLARILKISVEEAKANKNKFNLNIKEIKRLEPADLNQELFDKLFGKDIVKTEEEFRAKVSENLKNGFLADANRLFKKDFANAFSNKLDLKLPSDFLKRWILSSNEKPLSQAQVDQEFPAYEEQLKWQIIENKIIEENNLQVDEQELLNYTKELLRKQFAQYGLPAEDAQLDGAVKNVLSDQKEARRINEMLYDEKVIEFIKENIKTEEKEVAYTEFVELFNK